MIIKFRNLGNGKWWVYYTSNAIDTNSNLHHEGCFDPYHFNSLSDHT
jgi:hypothetical protein